jgi:transcriptional regulator with XRE-family HTH domain
MHYALISHYMQQDSARLGALMNERGLSQDELAECAGVSQSTVSRALRKGPQRNGRARLVLFTFVENELNRTATAGTGRDQVMGAFDRIWDGSEVHAAAVVKVIEALMDLRPFEKQKE